MAGNKTDIKSNIKSDIDYRSLGFKCGIEIHQQLDTNKLFCDCPSLVNDTNKPDILIKRRLRAVVGETGEIDAAAKHEVQKQKTYIYESCSSSSCLVELDEEPPHPINQDALKITLQVARLLNARIVDEIQVMRKTVVDGSNVGGFQRTALIAVDGYIETSKGKIGIPTICLEEEAAKKIKTEDSTITYRLDRLGVPLIELASTPEIQDAEHAKEVCSILGMMLRSTGKVKRGIGTIRQDVNVSIKGGARIEVKGFQDLRSIPKVIDYEIKRQLSEIRKGDKVKKEVRKAEPDFTTSFMRPMPGSARMYPETDVLPIRITKEMLDSIEDVELLADKEDALKKKYRFDDGIIKELIKNDINLESLMKKYPDLDAKAIAETMINIPKELNSRLKIDPSSLTTKDFDEVLEKLNSGKIPKESVIDILAMKAKGEIVDYSRFKVVDDSEVEKLIKTVVDKNKGAPLGALMGMCMKELRGKADGSKVSAILKKYIG